MQYILLLSCQGNSAPISAINGICSRESVVENGRESVVLGVGTITFTSEAIPRQVLLASLQVEPVALHNKTLVRKSSSIAMY